MQSATITIGGRFGMPVVPVLFLVAGLLARRLLTGDAWGHLLT